MMTLPIQEIDFHSMQDLFNADDRFKVIATENDCLIVKKIKNGYIGAIPYYQAYYHNHQFISDAGYAWCCAKTHYENFQKYKSGIDIFNECHCEKCKT